MNFVEFIKNEYPEAIEKIKAYKSDPITRIMESDDLPYDDIRVVEGQLQKVVYLNDDDVITVFDLLTYTKEDIESMKDNEELKAAYMGYMDLVDITDMTIDNIMKSVQEYKAVKESKGKLLEKCIS